MLTFVETVAETRDPGEHDSSKSSFIPKLSGNCGGWIGTGEDTIRFADLNLVKNASLFVAPL